MVCEVNGNKVAARRGKKENKSGLLVGPGNDIVCDKNQLPSRLGESTFVGCT